MIISREELSCRGLRQLSVYIHIPFCVKKCDYCDFLSAPASQEEIQNYCKTLVDEIKKQAASYRQYVVTTVFLGGGTPSLLSIEQLAGVLNILKATYNVWKHAEISIEINPGTVEKQKVQGYLDLGINRISIGLQSTKDEELRRLGRIHNYQQFLETYKLARDAGFKNLNVDIMAALPGQTIESYTDTLTKVTELEPEHISAYSLIVEEETPFFERYQDGNSLPSEELDREMYEVTKRILEKKGYQRYEISNYAKKGYECQHNLVYWTRQNYVGFGVGAASMIENVRWNNSSAITEYLLSPEKVSVQKLSKKDQMEEFMFLGLRLTNGIQICEFREAFGVDIQEVYGGVMEKLKGDQLLEERRGQIFLTNRGLDLSNFVFEQFLLS